MAVACSKVAATAKAYVTFMMNIIRLESKKIQ